jgi:hypothetical protein
VLEIDALAALRDTLPLVVSLAALSALAVMVWQTQSRSKTLRREVDAKRFLVGVEHSKQTNTYMDPSRSKIKVGAWARQWLDAQTHLKPSTRARYSNICHQAR